MDKLKVSSRTESGHRTVTVEGPLLLAGRCPELESAVLEGDLPGDEVHLDFRGVTEINTIGAAAILETLVSLQEKKVGFKFLGLSAPVHKVLSMVPHKAALEKTLELRPPPSLLEQVGENFYKLKEQLTSVVTVCSNSLYWSFVAPLLGRGLKGNYVLQQISRNGVDAIPILSLIMFVIGLIMALQADYQLRRIGASIYMADLVGVGLTRELGPLMAAVILSGRSGAAMAAEIGTMRVTEEIDALTTMGMNPFKYVLAPRVLGLFIALPLLTLLGDCIGIFGGYVIGVFYKEIPSATYIEATRNAIALSDIFTGILKSAAFALIISLASCYKGYAVGGGPQEIGQATTSSVVISLFLVIAADGFFTYLFYLLG